MRRGVPIATHADEGTIGDAGRCTPLIAIRRNPRLASEGIAFCHIDCEQICAEDENIGIQPDGAIIAATVSIFDEFQATKVTDGTNVSSDMRHIVRAAQTKRAVIGKMIIEAVELRPRLNGVQTALDPARNILGSKRLNDYGLHAG